MTQQKQPAGAVVPKPEAVPDSKPVAVLDTSALMAHLNEEKGSIPVRKAIEEGAAMSVV